MPSLADPRLLLPKQTRDAIVLYPCQMPGQPADAIAVQLWLMTRLIKEPRKLAPWYNATGVTLYVLGMLVSAFALGAGAGASS